MSNPGVINLAQTEIGMQQFRIEDNIGEAIHIHYGNIRADFSISEFIELTNSLISIVEKMVHVKNFNFCSYDAIWLSQSSELMLKLQKIEFKRRNVGNMVTNHFEEDGQSIISIRDSRVAKAIHGDLSEMKGWLQTNYVFEDNISRMKRVYESIVKDGYHPEKKGTYVVICDGGNFVVDGCHRVSSIYELYGDIDICVADWITENDIWSDQNRHMRFEEERYRIALGKKQVANKRIFRKWQTQYLAVRDFAGKKIIIKGAGEHTRQFIDLCGDKINVVGILAKEILDESLKCFNRIDEKELRNIDAQIIFISSYKHRCEMKKELEKFRDQFEIYDLYEQGIDKEFFSD